MCGSSVKRLACILESLNRVVRKEYGNLRSCLERMKEQKMMCVLFGEGDKILKDFGEAGYSYESQEYILSEKYSLNTIQRVLMVAEQREIGVTCGAICDKICVIKLKKEEISTMNEFVEFKKRICRHNVYCSWISEVRCINVLEYMLECMLCVDEFGKSYFEGANGWDDFNSLFSCLNNAPVQYCILRNSKYLPDAFWENDHDIDLLCNNLYHFVAISNAYRRAPGVSSFEILIEGQGVPTDIRFLGDDYYYFAWEKDLLDSARINEKGISIIDADEYVYSLLYHALIQKQEFPAKYIDEMEKCLGVKYDVETYLDILADYMNNKAYFFVMPKDYSVVCNIMQKKLPAYVYPVMKRGRKQLIKDIGRDISEVIKCTFRL